MDEVNERTQRLKEQKSLTKKELFEKQVYVDQQLRAITQEMKGKINQMVDDVEQKVSNKTCSTQFCCPYCVIFILFLET